MKKVERAPGSEDDESRVLEVRPARLRLRKRERREDKACECGRAAAEREMLCGHEGDGCSAGEICSRHEGNIKERLGGHSSISLCRSPPPALFCHLSSLPHSCLTCLFFFSHPLNAFLRHSNLFIFSLTVTVEPSSSFLTLGTRREISLALEFRAGSCRVSLSSLSVSDSIRQHGPKLLYCDIRPGCTLTKFIVL